MFKPIAISLSPNTEKDDVVLALKTIFTPKKWFDEKYVALLEKEFSRKFGKNYRALAVNSGRGAQALILKALGIGRGDEVAVQAFTCAVVPNAILRLRARPVYIDIDKSYNMSADDLKKKITPRTKAIIVQHTFGIPANLSPIQKIARANKIALIEDGAHALGATYQKKPVGSFGEASFFSFGRDKVLSSVFGGLVLCAQPRLYQKIKKSRDKLPSPSPGWILQQLFHPLAFQLILPLYSLGLGKLLLFSFQQLRLLSKAICEEEKLGQQPKMFPQKMPGGLAILARNQLKKLNRFNRHRQKIARFYFSQLKNTSFQLPADKKGAIWLRFPIRHPQARRFYQKAKKRGILLGSWYQEVVEPAKSLSLVRYKKQSCPRAEKFTREIINLPTYPTLSLAGAERVVKILKQ